VLFCTPLGIAPTLTANAGKTLLLYEIRQIDHAQNIFDPTKMPSVRVIESALHHVKLHAG
jgi:hypothetical protein